MKKLLTSACCSVFFLGVSTLPSFAETINIGISQQAPEHQGISRPQLGMTKDAVTAAFGEPLQRYAAIGEPPISRWQYAQFSVYFEHDTVLHTVLHHQPNTDAHVVDP